LNRFPLSVALSSDGGHTWSSPRILSDPGLQVSYPGLTQANDGRDIRWARFTREWVLGNSK
jgi:hypothetical protein